MAGSALDTTVLESIATNIAEEEAGERLEHLAVAHGAVGLGGVDSDRLGGGCCGQDGHLDSSLEAAVDHINR